MSAIQIENVSSNENQNVQPKTCEYKGLTYFIMTDMETKKCFIEVDGQRLYLDCNGNVANKQPGGRNIKTCLDSYEDIKKICDYLLETKKWNYYLLFVLNMNTGRRIGDILKSKWCDMFECKTDDEDNKIYDKWKIRKFWYLQEEKTEKKKDIKLNKAVKYAFNIFFENETAFEKNEKTYNDYIFKQLHGTHKGNILTQEAYRLLLKKVKKEAGLDEEIRSHSMRRGLCTLSIENHPDDPKAKTIMMSMYNHSSEAMQAHYTGQMDKLEEKYLDDMGDDFEKYIINGEEVPFRKKVPRVTCNTTKLLDKMRESAMYFMAKGMENANVTDPKKIMEMMNEAMKKVEEILEEVSE